jgi:hypothetical protein
MLVQGHPDYKAEGFSEYMNGYYNGLIAGLEYERLEQLKTKKP